MNAATTYTNLPGADRGAKGQGWGRRLFNRFIAARQREANRRIAQHLSGFDDKALKALNLNADEIARLRSGSVLSGPDGRRSN